MTRHTRSLCIHPPACFAITVLLLLAGSLSFAQTPDRSVPPQPGPPPSLKLPTIQRFTLGNGLPVVMMEKRGVPLVEIDLIVRAGAASETRETAGLASMAAAMLTEGAGLRDALQLADAVDFLGARLSAGAGTHTTAVSLFTPISKLDSALALMADVVLRPTFPPAELDRKRRERLTALLQWRDEPSALASVAFSRALFGDDHPYGRPSIGNEASIRAVTVEALRKFHDTAFRPNNATLVVAGDVSVPEIRRRLEAAFGSWKKKPVLSVEVPPAPQVQGRTIVLVDKPGAAQTQIRLGRIGAARLSPDYYTLTVLNTVLGGSFTSRLNTNLREVHGYSYGAGSRFDFRPVPGPFLAAAAVQTGVTDSALSEFMKELRAIREPVPDEELTRARNYVALGYPGDFQTVGQLAAQLGEMVTYNLPEDSFNRYIGEILAVGQEDVKQAARKYIDPDNMVIILVGDRSVIEAGVEGLNLGTVKNMTIEDLLGPPPVVNPESAGGSPAVP